MSVKRKPGMVVRYAPSARIVEVSFDGKLHAHRCERCGRRYADNCFESTVDGTCAPCRMGVQRPLWDLDADPALCCVERSRLATVEQRRLYGLAGRAIWWVCQVCKRTHPYDPKENIHGHQAEEAGGCSGVTGTAVGGGGDSED